MSEPLSPRDALHRIVDKRTADNDGYWISAREMRYAEEALAASERPPVDPLREAAQAVVNGAEPDDNFDGEFIEYLVSFEAINALRAALASPAAPRPEGLDVDELIGKVSVLLDGPSDAAVRRAVVRVIIGWARLSDTGDTPEEST